MRIHKYYEGGVTVDSFCIIVEERPTTDRRRATGITVII